MPVDASSHAPPKPLTPLRRGLPFIGATFRIRRNPLGFLQFVARNYGDLVSFRLMGRPAFLLAHPDYIRDVLVSRQANFTKSPALQRAKRLLGNGLLTSEGETHLYHRRLIQPAFQHDRLQSYAEITTAFGIEARERWRPGETIDMLREMMRLTLLIVARALFGTDAQQDAASVARALADVESRFRYLLFPFSNLLFGLPLPLKRRFEQAKSVLDQTVYRMIQQHRAAGTNCSPDLLGALLNAHDEQGEPLSDAQLRDEVLTLLLAGHETTAIGLTWTWYLLARHPSCEARLHTEIDSVLNGRPPTFADIARLPYTERVISESVRLYPPVWNIGRLSKQPFEMGGGVVPAGSICLMSPYVLHRDPRFFPDPERFDPDRWEPACRESRPKFSYFPFGGGARVCIGERFAWNEMILLIATLAQKWSFRLLTTELPGLRPLIALHPRSPILMTPCARG